MNSSPATTWSAHSFRMLIGWLLMGFSLGGFFDGIVLHQILQWHHLLSGLDNAAGSNLPFQIMADGLFHLLMYAVAILGACILLSAHASGVRASTTSQMLQLTLVGFGIWHITDAVISHWLVGLHRIKMDSDVPLAWDIGWLVIFGVVPLIFAALFPRRGGRSRGANAALIAVVATAGAVAAVGPRNAPADETIIVFRPDMSQAAMMEAVIAADAELKWTDASGMVWALNDLHWPGLVTLHLRGALVASSTPLIAGCLAWTRNI